MKLSLEKRIIFFSFVILFVTILAHSAMDIAGFRRDYIQALTMRSQSLGANVKANIEKVVALGVDITSLEGLKEKCAEIVKENQEIAYCIVTDIEGHVLYFNDPRFSSLRSNAADRQHYITDKPFAAELVFGNEKFYDTVTYIKTPDGKIAGLVHVGYNSQVVNDKVNGMIVRSIGVLLISFMFSFSVVVVFAKHNIMQPLSALLKGVKGISDGDLSVKIKDLHVFEFSELAKSINFMSSSLKNREDEIRKSYKDLENAHKELRSSYVKLESLSLDLERSEELYKSLLEDASDAILVVNDDETVRMVNKMAEEFFGYSAPEIVGLPLTKLLLLLNIENIPRILQMFHEAFVGNHLEEELHFVNKSGSALVGLVHASSVKSGDRTLVQVIVRDITRERHIMANLEKSTADLTRLNKMKDSFLGLASHELKTPLTVIMGYSELILSDLPEKIDKSVYEMVENIARAAHRLDNIVHDMVDVSMIDERRLQLRLDDVDVNKIVETSIEELKLFTSVRNQEFELVLDPMLPAVKGDPNRLMQLLSNVVGNAIKFTPDGGKISISTRVQYLVRPRQGVKATVGQLPGKEHHVFVEIIVTDTGIGIDREDQARIFEKFYEVGKIEEHSSGKVAFNAKGAGLGLSIAKGIVEMHGGDIWVESPGYDPVNHPGSTFHILLPLVPSTEGTALDYLNILS